jgi:hypothetical protein
MRSTPSAVAVVSGAWLLAMSSHGKPGRPLSRFHVAARRAQMDHTQVVDVGPKPIDLCPFRPLRAVSGSVCSWSDISLTFAVGCGGAEKQPSG